MQLHELRARLYVCGPSMQHFKVDPKQLLFPEIRIAAYPTFVEQMQAAGVQIFLQ